MSRWCQVSQGTCQQANGRNDDREAVTSGSGGLMGGLVPSPDKPIWSPSTEEGQVAMVGIMEVVMSLYPLSSPPAEREQEWA